MKPRLGSAFTVFVFSSLFATAAQAGSTFCCADDKGKQVCSDVLPPACYGKAYREINERGITVKRVDAPLTAEQLAKKEEEAKQAKEEAQRKLEQDHKNRALLATYATEQDIDYMRNRAVSELQKAIEDSKVKLDDVAKKQVKLNEEAEFYKKKTLPFQLRNAMRENEDERKTFQSTIDTKQKDIAAVKAKYDDELARYRELKGGKKPATVAAEPSAADRRPR